MIRHPGSFVTGIVFMILGVAFLGDSFDWWSVDVGRLWPIVLIAVGAVILLTASRKDDD